MSNDAISDIRYIKSCITRHAWELSKKFVFEKKRVAIVVDLLEQLQRKNQALRNHLGDLGGAVPPPIKKDNTAYLVYKEQIDNLKLEIERKELWADPTNSNLTPSIFSPFSKIFLHSPVMRFTHLGSQLFNAPSASFPR